jgi:TonB family protein
MCCKHLLKRLIPFSIAIAVGVLATSFFQTENFVKNNVPIRTLYAHKEGCEEAGFTDCKGEHTHFSPYKESDVSPDKPLKILAQPRAEYTDEGRFNNVTGIVRLRIEFLSNGKLGKIVIISGLPYGLTNQALEAAKNIKFEPKTENGKYVATSKIVEYRFTLY